MTHMTKIIHLHTSLISGSACSFLLGTTFSPRFDEVLPEDLYTHIPQEERDGYVYSGLPLNIIGDKLINPIVRVYIPIIRIPPGLPPPLK